MSSAARASLRFGLTTSSPTFARSRYAGKASSVRLAISKDGERDTDAEGNDDNEAEESATSVSGRRPERASTPRPRFDGTDG